MQNNPYGNPPPYGAPPGGGFGSPPGGGFGGPPGGFGAPPPGPGGYGPPPGGGGAIEKTKLPAIFMMIAMGIGIAWQLFSLVLNLLGTGMGAMGGGDVGSIMSGVVGLVFNFISLFTGGFVIFAMIKMMKGQGWGLALAGVIVGMLPCLGPCCWFGIPVGIWALVVLMDENVKRQFQS